MKVAFGSPDAEQWRRCVSGGLLALAVAIAGAIAQAPARCVATWQGAPVAQYALDRLVPQPALAVRLSRTVLKRLLFWQS